MPFRKPVIVVNFKTYPEASGPGALALAKLCAQISSETGAPLIVAPPMLDLAIVASTVKIPVFAQHVDSVQSGSTTGHVTVENAKASGALGTLVNHSERRIKISEIHEIIDRWESRSCDHSLHQQPRCEQGLCGHGTRFRRDRTS